ncbi:hypothetical protein EMCG_01263 [[Emmonsia] crescens]|uniref:Mid2 domain-containing protein n=1 Tax=[Emmonsia] crescens TaxID=73230 RepID=A0A0G2JAG7_9EURO|nr:hypothetical protein EMCG_01263 [Emmonsia crescens UAMH 3008]
MKHPPFAPPFLYALLSASLSLLLLSTPSYAAVRTCYLPNGKIAENDAPCFPQNPESACCGGSTYVCSTNNMCAHYDGSYYIIGSCTDPTWNSPGCPGYCYFRDHVHNSVRRCADDSYCCFDGPQCNCTTRVNAQKIFDFLPPYSALVGSSVSLNTAVATTSLVTPPGATPPASTTASTAATESNPSTNSDAQSISATASGPGSGQSAINPTSTWEGDVTLASELPVLHDNENNIGMKVGLGVGIPLAVIAVLLAALVYRVWKRGASASAGAGAGAGAGHRSAPAAAAAGGGIGFFSRLRSKDDPTSCLPMLENTSPPAAPLDEAVNQPANGRGFVPMHGQYKLDDTGTPHIIHEAP